MNKNEWINLVGKSKLSDRMRKMIAEWEIDESYSEKMLKNVILEKEMEYAREKASLEWIMSI